ncbi:MAG: VanZ family protein [Rubricoccaceae bacterium]
MPRPLVLATLWTILATVLLLLPGEYIPDASVLGADKLVHAGIFALFAVLWLAAFPAAPARVLLVGLLFATGTELLQAAMGSGRMADPYDIVANVVGLGLGTAAFAVRRRLQPAEGA